MFQDATDFDQNLGWCVAAGVFVFDMFLGAACTAQDCGVEQKDEDDVCSPLP